MGESLGTAVLDLSANTAPLKRAVGTARIHTLRELTATAMQSKKIMAGAFLAVGVVAAVGLKKVGDEFTKANNIIRKETGATDKEFEGLEKSFEKVFAKTPANAEATAKAIGQVNTRLKLTGSELEARTEQFLNLSKVTGEDLESAIRGVSRAFIDWEVANEDQAEAMDGFLRLSQETGVEVSALTSDIQKFGSPLRQLGFGLEEAAAMFAQFEAAGVNAQTMVPGFKLAIGNILKPTDDLRERMKDLGVDIEQGPEDVLRDFMGVLNETGDMAEKKTAALDLFGKRAGADMVEAIQQGRFELDELIDIFENGEGSINETAEATREFDEKMTMLGQRGMLAVKGPSMIFIDGLTAMSNLMLALPQPMIDLIGILAGLALAIGAATVAVKVFNATLLLNPYVALAAATIAIGVLIVKNWDAIRDRTIAIWDGIKDFFARWWPALLIIATGGLGAIAVLVIRNWDKIRDATRAAWDRVKTIVGNVWERIKTIVGDATGWVTQAVGSAWDGVRTGAETAWGAITDVIQGAVRGIRQIFSGLIGTLRRLLRVVAKAGEALVGPFVDAANAIADAFGWIVDRVNDLLDALDLLDEKLPKPKTGGSLFGIKIPAPQIPGIGSQRGGQIRPALREGGLASVVPGSSTGDRHTLSLNGVPVARVESKEGIFVGNRNMMSALAEANERFPRFQAGGMVRPSGPAGGRGAVINAAIAQEASAWMNRFGMLLTAGYNPNGPHVSPGHNVTGTALDTVPLAGWTAAATTLFEQGLRAAINAGKKVLYGSGGVGTAWPNHGFANHAHTEWGMSGAVAGGGGGEGGLTLPELNFRGPGVLGAMGQEAVDRVLEAANDFLSTRMVTLPVSAHGATDGPLAEIAQRMVSNAWGPGQWPPFLELKVRESGPTWDPTITNPSSGAGGIPQGLPPSKMGSPAWPPTQGRESAVAQIAWMVNYIRDRYGTPTAALAFHDRNNWYQRGGMLDVGKIIQQLGDVRGEGQRRSVLRDARRQAEDIGLPFLSGDGGELAGGFAERAEEIGRLGEWAQMASTLGGPFRGGDEGTWLTQQLELLFQQRNRLIEAQQRVVSFRERTTEMIEEAQRQLKRIQRRIKQLRDERRRQERRLANARGDAKKPIRRRIRGIDEALEERVAQAKDIRSDLIPMLKDRRTAMVTGRGTILSELQSIQGAGASMQVMGTLPAIGTLGGEIFQVQHRLAGLGQDTPQITDDTSGRLRLTEERLREAQRRATVAELQFDVLRDMPQFHIGGLVDGGMPLGTREVIAKLEKGEGVIDATTMRRGIGDSEKRAPRGPTEFVITNWREGKGFFREIIGQETRQRSPVMPGRGGGVR